MAAQIIQSHPDKLRIKYTLFEIVKSSKENKESVEKASSNAITILNFTEYDFSYNDFSDIYIPNANLKFSQLFYVNFSRANLQDVKFESADLYEAIFN